jgi:predicted transcriptional regulator of viral defense system
MKGLSSREIEVVSYLELDEKFFFVRDDIRKFFKNDNEMNVYIHRLKEKGRIIKLNRVKYYLIPVRAYKGHWSEHPFIIIDEIFNGRDYLIGGMAAAYHWGLIDQIPATVEVYCTKKQGQRRIFDFTMIFKRVRPAGLKGFIRRNVGGHPFSIASKDRVEKWLGSR